MNHSLQVYFSNRVEELFLRLKDVLYAPPSTPFTRRLVIVPSPAIKSWLMLTLAQDTDLGIAAGIEIAYLDQSIDVLRTLFGQRVDSHIPNALELALAIEWRIRKQLAEPISDILWQPLFVYLKAEPGMVISKKTERRLIALAETLGQLFLQYGKHAGRMVQEWESTPDRAWQQTLWKQLFGKESQWSYLYRELNRPLDIKSPPPDLAVHLFSLSYLPAVQHRFLQQIAPHVPVHYYLLSPCLAFWSDIRSDRETRRLKDYWLRRGINSSQQIELEAYLKDCNPLLANFGRLGREMALQIEQSLALTTEQYWLPDTIQEHPQYESCFDGEIGITEASHPLTLLEAIQADMLLLRSPKPDQKINFSQKDHSFQVHAAPTRLREVEVLYDAIMRLIDAESQSETPITPGDILVMAPDIMEYAPLIKMIFGAPNSALDVQIMDLHVLAHDPFVQAFIHLLNLASSRWEVAALVELFHFPAFQRQQKWSAEDLELIVKWLKVSGINWGLNSTHRNEILQREHCTASMLDTSPNGTWEFGLHRLLMGLAMQIQEGDPVPIVPLEGVDTTQAELIGKLIHLMASLRRDLKMLSDGTRLTLKDWSRHLKNLYKTYFALSNDEDDTRFLQHLEAFENATGTPATTVFAFASIKKHLESALAHQTATYRESHVQAVKFCTLLPMRTVPAKIIALIGMDEGAFPKRDHHLSLNLMRGNPKAEYAPSQTDFDRYLFLEALLSARGFFIMTYCNYDSEDFKEQSPSLLIAEMLSYIDKAYTIAEQSPSPLCCVQHPFHAFDKRYFEPHSPYRSYSHWQYQNACAYYQVDKQPVHRFIPHYVRQAPQIQENIKVTLRELDSFAKNPLKVYFNKTLGMYVDREEDRQWESTEKLQLNRLDIFKLKESALRHGMKKAIEHSLKSGELPLGVFKELGIDQFTEEFAKLQENYSEGGIDLTHLASIELSEQCETPQQVDEKNWVVPALTVSLQDQSITIIGKLSDVSAEGLVFKQDNKVDKIVKVWPQCIVYHNLLQHHALKFAPRVFFAKTGRFGDLDFMSPTALEKYLEYYLIGLKHASPLQPEWVKLLLDHQSDEFKKKIEESLHNPFSTYYNPYLTWSFPQGIFPDTASMIHYWKELAQELYGDASRHWTGRKKR